MSVRKKLFFIIAAAVLIAGAAAAVFFTRPVVQVGRALKKSLAAVSAGAVLSIYTNDYTIYSVDTWLNNHALILHSENFPGENLCYPYTEDKSGSGLEEILGEDGVGRIDTFLKMYYSAISGKTNKKLLKDLQKLKFERTDEKELHVDNISNRVRGLQTHITSGFLKKLLEDMGEDSKTDVPDMKNLAVTFYLSGGYVAEIDVSADGKDPAEILFEEKGRRVSVTDTGGNELALTFSDGARPLSQADAQDLSKMSAADLRSFVMRMVIRGSGLSF